MGMQYGTARNLCTIARSQKLTARDGTNVCRVQLVMQTVIPGVQAPKKGIGSEHRRIPNTRQNDVESKMLDTISHGGTLAVDKSTTGRFPYQQGTFLRGLQVKIRVNR